jgi:hypothetical protein
VPRAAVALLLASSLWAKKPPPHPAGDSDMPLRVVIEQGHQKMSNCIFAKQPIPARARYDTRLADAFGDGEALYARCYLPERVGSNKPGELTDVLYLDGRKWWTQAYDQSIPPDALERAIALGEILRGLRAAIPPGDHLVRIEGLLTRGKHAVKLYRGEFRYLR